MSSNKINFKIATFRKDFKIIEDLADVIWRGHYIPIIGEAQIDYMLDKFQSAKAIEIQVTEGYEYYLIMLQNTHLGYVCIKKDKESLFLSKLYILDTYRGKGYGKESIEFIIKKAKLYGLKNIRLTVNVNNLDSITAYERLGFNNNGSIKIDIGNGFIMDDYEMIKPI